MLIPSTGGTRPGGRRRRGPRRQRWSEVIVHVLFVCTGNICRSPMAERLATLYAEQQSVASLHTSSAGTRAVIASAIHPEAAAVIRALGGDPTDFSARQLSRRVLADADLVVTMGKEHRDAVLDVEPRMLRRTFTMSEAAYLSSLADVSSVEDFATFRPRLSGRVVADIADPIGRPPQVFGRVGDQIATNLKPLLGLLKASLG